MTHLKNSKNIGYITHKLYLQGKNNTWAFDLKTIKPEEGVFINDLSDPEPVSYIVKMNKNKETLTIINDVITAEKLP